MGLLKRLKKRKQRSATIKLRSSAMSQTPRVLFVSHEATRTGAPKIILNLLKYFHEKTNVQLQSILHSGGFLAEEFAAYSEVDCLNLPREPSDELGKRVRRICLRHRNNPPAMAICNSMESRFIAYELHRMGIPISFLIHELPSSYEVEDYNQVFECSERVIFPVNVVSDAVRQKTSLPDDKSFVLPQGLLNPHFGTGVERQAAREQIRRELKLPEDAWLVLGCGTLDLRKGIDHFCSVARALHQRNPEDRPVHFVWLGEGDRWAHTPYHYAMLDIEKSNLYGKVHFIGERENVEPYFVGSDCFLLTSRVDPFPCVLHEAMASRVPIITFDRSGGAVECVSEGAGLVVPYGDHVSMAEMIDLLSRQSHLAKSICDAAEAKVRTKYQFEAYGNRMIQFAEQTMQRQIASKPYAVPAGHDPELTHPVRRAA